MSSNRSNMTALVLITVFAFCKVNQGVTGFGAFDNAGNVDSMSYVIEPFDSMDYSYENRNHWFGTSNYQTQTDSSSIANLTIMSEGDEILFGKGALQIDYNMMYANDMITFGWIQASRTHNCYKAETFSIWYKHIARNKEKRNEQQCHLKLRLTLFDDSTCIARSKHKSQGQLCTNESSLDHVVIFEEKINNVLFDRNWVELVVPVSEFPRLNLQRIRGWKVDILDTYSDNAMNSSCTGTIWIDQLQCHGSGEMLGAAFHVVDTNINYTMDDAVQDRTWARKYFKSNISEEKTTMVLDDAGNLAINYTVEQVESWGGYVSVSYVAPGMSYYNLSLMSYLTLEYKILEPESAPGRSMFRVVLLDGSDCNTTCDLSDSTQERYYSFHDILSSNSTKEGVNMVTIPFVSGTKPEAPFWLTGWEGINGNSILDLDQLKGIYFEININGVDGTSTSTIGTFDSGALVLSNLTARQYTNASLSNETNCIVEKNIGYTLALSSFKSVGALGAICHNFCVADQTCNYAVLDDKGTCYVADSVHSIDVRLSNSNFQDTHTRDACWVDSVTKRGDFCDKCKCNANESSVDCRGANLTTIPKTFNKSFNPRILDLRDNPELIIIGSGALSSVGSTLEQLLLPANLSYVAFETLAELNPSTKIVSETWNNGRYHASNFIKSTNENFQDVCCAKGPTLKIGIDEFTFCEMKKNTPGTDAVYEDFVEYEGSGLFLLLTPSSSFMSEAAESYQKCAEYCTITQHCDYFSYDARIINTFPRCYLWQTKNVKPINVCCESDHYADQNKTLPGWISGRPPRTRAVVDNAVVQITSSSSSSMTLNEKNNYSITYDITLGSQPLRGAVWIEPTPMFSNENGLGLHVEVLPNLVALYDAGSKQSVRVTVSNVSAGSDATLIMQNYVTSCDVAFTLSNDGDRNVVFIQVKAPIVRHRKMSSLLAVSVATVSLLLTFVLLFVHFNGSKNVVNDSAWTISVDDLHFADPPQVIGRGSFGVVLVAEYRGTQCAVKRSNPMIGLIGDEAIVDFDQTEYFATVAGSSKSIERGCWASEDLEMPSEQCQEVTRISTRLPSRKSIWLEAKDLKTKEKFSKEIRILSTLRHPCIATVMGATFHRSNIYMVLEYMEHGSLHDLLHNETVVLDEMMLLHMLQDVSQGIRFLHSASPPVFHGNLKTQNILVDRQFRAKVSDFGLTRQPCPSNTGGTQYWKAPELLRGKAMCNAQTDIYAFGIILYEVYTRKDPSDGEEPSEVLRLVTDNEVDNRPVLPLTCSAPVQSLIIDCLEEASDKRPTSEELDIRLKRLETKNDLDSARKVDSHDRGAVSLFDIFPAHIAEALSQGKKVEPEYRDVVTIFFSDIVNFTTISSSLEPRKVAQMLDRLYSVFDELSHKHDVFKVETIGDAYMAVTNLVSEQPNDHTKRIACFAIDAIEAAQKVMIDEDNPGAGYISIRVGFHSGPVVADVVGNRNPRYCLFGDTVNCASRMESNSDINRILCSDYSAQLLNAQCPEIPVAARGMVAIKGKGEMSTFWVNERGMGLKSNSGHDLKGWLSILSPDEEQPRDNLDVRNKYQSSEPTLRRSFRLLQKLSGLDTSGHRSRENKST